MAFNPFNLFKGNPKVLELINKNQPIQLLVMEDAFVSQFKRSQNEPLHNYMNYERYEQLIKYITVIDHQQVENKNRTYRYIQDKKVSNELTHKYLLTQVVFSEEDLQQQIEVEVAHSSTQKQIDSESSERSFSSIRSGSSLKSKDSKQQPQIKYFQEQDKQNFVLRSSQDRPLDDILAQSKEISQDDFPDAKIKKTIMVKQIAKRTVKKPLQPLIFKLLRYFQNKEIVHILDGYVCKVLDSLVANAYTQLMSILEKYNKTTYLSRVFRHIESNSVEEFVLNLAIKSISSQGSSFMVDLLKGHCLIYTEDWRKCDMSVQNRGCLLKLYALVTDKITANIKERVQDSKEGQAKIQKQLKMLSTIVNSGHVSDLTDLFAELAADKKIQEAQILKGFLKILRNILNSFVLLRSYKGSKKLSEDQLTLVHQMADGCEDMFDPLINFGLSFIFEDILMIDATQLVSYKPENPLSMKVQFLQLIGCLSVQNIYFSRRTLIDSMFYDHLFKLLDIYPNSSIFHNALMKLVHPFLNAESNDIATINKFFQKQRLLSYIYRIVQIDYEIRYESKKKHRSCYIGHIISVCFAIEKFQCEDSEYLCKYKQSEEWQYIHQCLIVQEKGVRKKLIGGFQKLNEKKPIIFFNKKDCLNNFRYFLSGNNYNDFEQFQNYEPGNSDSEDQSSQERKKFEVNSPQFVPDLEQKKYFDEDVAL